MKIVAKTYSLNYILNSLPFIEEAAPSNNVLLTVNKGQFDSFFRIGTGGRSNFAFGLMAGNCRKGKEDKSKG